MERDISYRIGNLHIAEYKADNGQTLHNIVEIITIIEDQKSKELKCAFNVIQGNPQITDYNLIEPIKISDKYLERLGFENVDIFFWIKNNMQIFVSSGQYACNLFADHVSVKLEYIHEVQNLYYEIEKKELVLASV